MDPIAVEHDGAVITVGPSSTETLMALAIKVGRRSTHLDLPAEAVRSLHAALGRWMKHEAESSFSLIKLREGQVWAPSRPESRAKPRRIEQVSAGSIAFMLQTPGISGDYQKRATPKQFQLWIFQHQAVRVV